MNGQQLAFRARIVVSEYLQNPTLKNSLVLVGKLQAIYKAAKKDPRWMEFCSFGFDTDGKNGVFGPSASLRLAFHF